MDILYVVLTSLLSAAALFIIAKFIGHKQISQLNIFDYITGITIGSIAAELATEIEEPLKPFCAMVVYGLFTIALGRIESKSLRSRKFISGSPTILMHGGRLYRENMKRAKLDLSEFLMLCRQAGYFDLTAIQTAVYETNGRISFLPTCLSRPATPGDLNLSPDTEEAFTEVVVDGRVLDDNLHRAGLDAKWLEKQLKAQGYKSVKEVYLGLLGRENSLSLYKNEKL